MGNAVVPLTMLAGGAALVYVGITNPAGGAFAGLGNLINSRPNAPAGTNPAAFSSTAADLAQLGALTSGAKLGTLNGSGPVVEVRGEVLTEAQTWLGVPYKWGGNTRKGIDCSGLTLQVYATVGIHLPRVSYLQAKRGKATSTPQPGDLVAFGRPVHHVGIYVGGGKLVHAPHPGTVVRIEDVWHTEPVHYRNLIGAHVLATKPKGGHA